MGKDVKSMMLEQTLDPESFKQKQNAAFSFIISKRLESLILFSTIIFGFQLYSKGINSRKTYLKWFLGSGAAYSYFALSNHVKSIKLEKLLGCEKSQIMPLARFYANKPSSITNTYEQKK